MIVAPVTALARLERKTTLLLVVDVQERLAAAMAVPVFERVVKNTCMLLDAAAELGVPVVASEQYPKGLGPTVAPIADRLQNKGYPVIDKLAFDALDEPRVVEAIEKHRPASIVVTGMETHVCVYQTVRSAAARGFSTHVVADAVSSRTEENRALGLALCERAGAVVTPAETVVFDLLERAGTAEFKTVSRLVK